MIGFRFAPKVKPFPDKDGLWIRIVLSDATVVQGSVFMLEKDKIIILDSAGGEATPEIMLQGDNSCNENGLVVTYTSIDGFNEYATKKPAPKIIT